MKKLLALVLFLSLPAFAVVKGSPQVQLVADQTIVHKNATITATGSQIIQNLSGRSVDLFINVKASPTGTTPTLTFSLQEVDPGDATTVIGTAVTGTTITAITTQTLTIPAFTSHAVKVTWTIGGTASPTFTQVYTTLRVKATSSYVQGLAGMSQSAATTLNAQCLDANINSCGAGSFISIDTSGQFEAWFSIPSSHNIVGGTIKADCSANGTTWVTSVIDDTTTSTRITSKALTSGVGYDASVFPCGGQRYSRIRLSAWTSGSGVATMYASLVKDPSVGYSGAPGSTTQPPVGAYVCGWNGTTYECGNVEANTRAARSVIYPVNVGSLGSYSACGITGTMAAGLAANSPVFAVRWGNSSNVALVRKITVAMASGSTAFTAGVGTFKLIAARAFTASDTAGGAVTLTTNNGKRKTAFGTTLVTDMRVSTTATLTAGTRTLDATPLQVITYGVPTTANNTDLATTPIWSPDFGGEWPLVLAVNEGFEIQSTVPATGTWTGTFCVEWLEFPGTVWP